LCGCRWCTARRGHFIEQNSKKLPLIFGRSCY
jgi:hypothetical protein